MIEDNFKDEERLRKHNMEELGMTEGQYDYLQRLLSTPKKDLPKELLHNLNMAIMENITTDDRNQIIAHVLKNKNWGEDVS